MLASNAAGHEHRRNPPHSGCEYIAINLPCNSCRSKEPKPDPASSLETATNEVQNRRVKVAETWNEFKMSTAVRRAKLEDSRKLQQFNRDCEELENWISQKLLIANDLDSTNLQVSLVIVTSVLRS